MAIVKLSSGVLGQAVSLNGSAFVVTRRQDSGIILFGPYETRPSGRYSVKFVITLADEAPPKGDAMCAYIDIVTGEGQVKLAAAFIEFTQLQATSSYVVGFELHEPRVVEYRVWSYGQVALQIGMSVEVEWRGEIERLAGPLSQEQREWLNERELLDGYLRNVSGLIHVGANLGQERRYYWLLGLDVVWVEPIWEIYERLVDNISPYPRQRAYNALLTSRRGEQIDFKIASNNGASSSILPLQDHAVIFPDVFYDETRVLTSTTLVDLVEDEGISLDHYEALTLDVEGAEKLILEGARPVLDRFRYVKCEVADFPVRSGTPTIKDLATILEAEGFQELARRSFAMGPGNQGTYWDIVWKKASRTRPLHEPGVRLPLLMDPHEVDGIEKCE